MRTTAPTTIAAATCSVVSFFMALKWYALFLPFERV